MKMRYLSNLKLIPAAAMVTLVVACGGGGSGGGSGDDVSASSESVVARGVITQLGSIWVNGVEYETPNGGKYSDDDSSSSVANYKVGQVVSVRGRRNDDGVSGTADEVEYEAEIEGEASGGQINGITVLINEKTNTDDIAGNTLVDTQRYEVSGFWINENTIEATYIKEDDDSDSDDEIKGFVKNDDDVAKTFEVRGITFNWTGTPDVSNDDFVEVHFGSCTTPPNVTCQAIKVEFEDDFFDRAEGLEVEIEGAVDLSTNGCPAEADFKVDGVCIDSTSKPAQWLDGLTEFGDLVQGSRVEVEGHMVGTAPNNYLRADKIKGRGNRVRISSVAETVDTVACTFTLIEGNISVTVLDCVNAFEGKTASDASLSIGNLLDEEVEVRGVRTGDKAMMAIRVKGDDLSGGGDRHEIRAEVDLGGADGASGRVKVMGIVSQGNTATKLEVDDNPFAGDLFSFLNLVDDNDDPADGSRDVLEVGFDIDSGDGSGGTPYTSGGDPYTAEEIEIEEEDD
jgi:hypothetical protein